MKYIVANWKMNMTLKEITEWVKGFSGASNTTKTIILAPSHPYLSIIKELGNHTFVAAQDVSALEKGAHTGESGAFQIREFAKYSIVGHSERKEQRTLVNAKVSACLQNGITPIICFVDLLDLEGTPLNGAILAWEDPNNISVNGAYREKDPKDIEAGINKIRATIPANTPLLYGGSVNRQNVGFLAKINKLDGALVGNASLDPKHFDEIIQAFD